MTEAEWLECRFPIDMLNRIHGKLTDRKLRLLVVACCRRIWHLMVDSRIKTAVEVAERFADGLAGQPAKDASAGSLTTLVFSQEGSRGLKETKTVADGVAMAAFRAVAWNTDDRLTAFFAFRSAAFAVELSSGRRQDKTTEQRAQADLIRCVFGPRLFRPLPTFDPTILHWNDATIPKLAKAIYHNRRFNDMPILADALEEAGCTSQDMLNHCRLPGEHVRGCWVLDLVLGKA